VKIVMEENEFQLLSYCCYQKMDEQHLTYLRFIIYKATIISGRIGPLQYPFTFH
jgi:hypothetical protein